MTRPRKPAKGPTDRLVKAALLNALREAEALLTLVPPRYGRKHTLETLAVLRAALALSRERRR